MKQFTLSKPYFRALKDRHESLAHDRNLASADMVVLNIALERDIQTGFVQDQNHPCNPWQEYREAKRVARWLLKTDTKIGMASPFKDEAEKAINMLDKQMYLGPTAGFTSDMFGLGHIGVK